MQRDGQVARAEDQRLDPRAGAGDVQGVRQSLRVLDPSALRILEEPTPRPRPGEVLIELTAVGVSFVDGLLVRGAYRVRPPLPFTPGSCVAGRVVAVGEGVANPPLGTAVATVLRREPAQRRHLTRHRDRPAGRDRHALRPRRYPPPDSGGPTDCLRGRVRLSRHRPSGQPLPHHPRRARREVVVIDE
ncbi:alcohol dehydrogenase catalytic domain-containing protein [Streptomyces fuscichromogenes]|uniref:alcohol dehydrogenase catalytic domain-containing protein n=1 Tax=Streptomyces fuscichromogenes TaxID=1324013 RepID=UPI00380CC3A4